MPSDDTHDDESGRADDGDLRIEITPLVSRGWRGPSGVPSPRLRRMALATATIVVILLALAFPLGGITTLRSALSARAVPVSPVRLTPALGAVPTNCPPGNPVRQRATSEPPAVGIAELDVWLVGFTGATATIKLAGGATRFGYHSELALLAGPHVPRTLTLAVRGMMGTANGTVANAANPTSRPDSSLTIQPSMGTPDGNGYRATPLNVYLPSSGCYYLDLSGLPGTFFAAGR